MRVKKLLAGIGLALMIILAFTWLGREIVIKPRNSRIDFYWIWYGTQAVIHQQNPYSAEVTTDMQIFFGGKPIEPEYYSHPFPFPAYLAIVFLPFGLLPYQTALLLWIGLQFPLHFTALYLMKDFLNLDIQGLRIILYFFVGSIGFLYPVLSYSLGQLGILIFFLYALIFYLLKAKHTQWAGIILAILAIRPDMFLVACTASIVLLWNSKSELKRLVFSSATSLVIINLATTFLLGFWYLDWINILGYYSSNNPFVHWPPDTLLKSQWAKNTLVLIIFAFLIWQFIRFHNKPTEDKKLLFISALITVFLTVNKLTGSYYMTLLLIPYLILLHFYSELRLQWIIWLMLFSPWVLWRIVAMFYPWSEQLLVPLSLLILQGIYLFTTKKRTSTAMMEAHQ